MIKRKNLKVFIALFMIGCLAYSSSNVRAYVPNGWVLSNPQNVTFFSAFSNAGTAIQNETIVHEVGIVWD